MAYGTEVKYSGSWRTITNVEVKYSGSWRTVKKIEVKYSGSWRTVYQDLAVSPDAINVSWTRFSAGTCYARIKWASDGNSYKNVSAGSTSMTGSHGTWLDAGSASEVWVQRTIDVGSLDVDAGSGRLQLNVDRTFGVQRSSTGTKSATVTFRFYDAASGGSEIGSAQIVLTATVDDM